MLPNSGDAELDQIVDDITRREQELVNAKNHWLATGRDLLRAKELIPHGGFEGWCGERLTYSKRTAARYMDAARAFDAAFKSDTVSDLPSLKVVQRIADHTEDLEERRMLLELACRPDKDSKRILRERLKPKWAEEDPPPLPVDAGRAVDARRKAIRLLADSLGAKLDDLLAICREAGSGEVLSEKFFNSLVQLRRHMTKGTVVAGLLTVALPPPSEEVSPSIRQ